MTTSEALFRFIEVIRESKTCNHAMTKVKNMEEPNAARDHREMKTSLWITEEFVNQTQNAFWSIGTPQKLPRFFTIPFSMRTLFQTSLPKHTPAALFLTHTFTKWTRNKNNITHFLESDIILKSGKPKLRYHLHFLTQSVYNFSHQHSHLRTRAQRWWWSMLEQKTPRLDYWVPITARARDSELFPKGPRAVPPRTGAITATLLWTQMSQPSILELQTAS